MRSMLSVNLREKVNLRGGVEHEGCRRSSGFHSVGLHVPQNTVRDQEMVTKMCVGSFFFFFFFAPRVHLHTCDLVCLATRLSLWSHRTNLTDERRGREGSRG